MRMTLKIIKYVTRFLFRLISAALAIFGIIALVISALLLDYMLRSEVEDIGSDAPRTAIVFTGDFDRIYKGLDLLASNRIDRMFITGVNGDAGLNTDRFAEQFELTPAQANWIPTGKIVLAADAHTTLENALEAACWLDSQPEIHAVTLITSQPHMARASVALQNTIAPIDVVRVISDTSDDYDKLRIDLVEFGKFIATWGITILPRALWPANEPTICETG